MLLPLSLLQPFQDQFPYSKLTTERKFKIAMVPEDSLKSFSYIELSERGASAQLITIGESNGENIETDQRIPSRFENILQMIYNVI